MLHVAQQSTECYVLYLICVILCMRILCIMVVEYNVTYGVEFIDKRCNKASNIYLLYYVCSFISMLVLYCEPIMFLCSFQQLI